MTRRAAVVCRRFRDEGRRLPEGSTHVGSWVEANGDRRFQLMECDDARLHRLGIARQRDLADVELVPVVPSQETPPTITPLR